MRTPYPSRLAFLYVPSSGVSASSSRCCAVSSRRPFTPPSNTSRARTLSRSRPSQRCQRCKVHLHPRCELAIPARAAGRAHRIAARRSRGPAAEGDRQLRQGRARRRSAILGAIASSQRAHHRQGSRGRPRRGGSEPLPVLLGGRLGNALQLRAGAGRLSGFPGRAPARPRPHARRARDAEHPVRYGAQQHVPGPHHVRRPAPAGGVQRALSADVRPVAGPGGVRDDPAPDAGIPICAGSLAAGVTPDTFVAEATALAQSTSAWTKVVDLVDGRTIVIKYQPMSGGGWVATHEDVTELRRQEQELRAQNVRFDTALNNMSQGLSMFDAEQRLVVCNERYAHLYGLPPELTRPGTTFQADPATSDRQPASTPSARPRTTSRSCFRPSATTCP